MCFCLEPGRSCNAKKPEYPEVLSCSFSLFSFSFLLVHGLLFHVAEVGERNAAASNVSQFVEDRSSGHCSIGSTSGNQSTSCHGKKDPQVLDESQKFYRLLQLLGEWHEHGAGLMVT